jgi:hypothetical protein
MSKKFCGGRMFHGAIFTKGGWHPLFLTYSSPTSALFLKKFKKNSDF